MIIKEKLSVRKVEELVKETKEAQNDIPTGKTKEAKITPLSFSQQKFRDDLTTLLKSKSQG